MDNFDKSKILDSVSKVVEPKKKKSKQCGINKLEFWCTACTQTFTIHAKETDGSFKKEQGICPHVVLKNYELLR
jgi:hypothetical protein